MRLEVFLPAFAAAAALAGDASAETACTEPKTVCVADGGYYAPGDDIARVTAVSEPILKELRTCLDAAGGKHITPALTMRWDADGHAVAVKIDVPGYDSLPCVARASGKLAALQNPHETAMRCEYGCARPKPKPAPAAPVVVGPPPATPSPPVAAPVSPQPAAGPKPQYERHWYGWQTLIADGASVSLFLGGLASETPGLTTAGYLSFVLATPITHWVHGNIGAGFGSIGIRLVMPPLAGLIGAFAGLAVATNGDKGSIGEIGSGVGLGFIVGTTLGTLGCSAIDAFALGYEKVTPVPQARLGKPRPYTLAPTLDLRSERAALGVRGTF